MSPAGLERDTVLLRPAAQDDLDALVALEERVFSGDRLSRRSLRRSIDAPTACFLVLTRGGAIVGDALVAFRRGSARARLYSLAVDPAAAGRGLGRQLLRACEAEAAARGATHLRLEVRSDNGPAVGLYRSSGYTAFGRYDDYYEDGADALRFEKPLGLVEAPNMRP